jgi:uncharacterized DUF497 family protein
MKIEFDPAKDAKNIRQHEGLSLALAAHLDWDRAVTWLDNRFHYDEIRMNAIAPMGNRLYFVTFTEHDEMARIISLRPANNTEKKRYVNQFR